MIRGDWRWPAALSSLLCLQAALAQSPSEHCVLSGAVVNSATNAGIPHALVTYFGPASGFRFTDTGGNFQVENVACGGFSISVSKPGFVSRQEDPAQPFLLFNRVFREAQESESDQPGAPPKPASVLVDLKPDSEPQRIVLVPLASVTGTVLDENSEPIAGVVVQAIAVKASLSGPEYVPAKTTHTDDRGHYDLLDLPPGDYVVRLAGESSSTQYFQGTLNPNNDHRGMQPVYYPNVNTLESAMALHLAPALKANADFQQPTEAAFDIDGRITGLVAQAWTQIQLYRDGDRIPLGRAFVNLTTGQFRMTDIPRGSYTLRVTQYQADPALWMAAEQPVTITVAPIQNLSIPLSGAVDIPVSVSYEAGAKDDGVVSLFLQPQHARENMRNLTIGKFHPEPFSKHPRSQVSNPVADSLQPTAFNEVIADKYRLTEQINGNDVYLASAKLGNLDVLHGEFTVGASSPGELHLTIRGDSATLQGEVTFQGKPAPGSQIYVIPTGSDTSGTKFGFCDPEGHYQVPGIAPGEYRVQAWKGAPTTKEILSGGGETVTLQANEQRTLALEASASEKQQ